MGNAGKMDNACDPFAIECYSHRKLVDHNKKISNDVIVLAEKRKVFLGMGCEIIMSFPFYPYLSIFLHFMSLKTQGPLWDIKTSLHSYTMSHRIWRPTDGENTQCQKVTLISPTLTRAYAFQVIAS